MSRKNTRKNYIADKSAKRVTADAWNNPALKIGMGSGNPTDKQVYRTTFLSNNYTELRSMYRCNWICRKVVDLAATDMLRSGFEIKGEIDPKKIKQITKEWKRLNINAKLFDALSDARLFGGSIAFMVISGQDPTTPLRPNTIKKGDFLGIRTFDRWQCIPSVEIDDVTDEPLYYMLVPISGDYGSTMKAVNYEEMRATGNGSVLVHHSRIIKFGGDRLPYIDWLNNLRWKASILESGEDRINFYNTATAAVSSMITKAGFRTIKINGLRDLLANRGNTDVNASYDQLVKLLDFVSTAQSLEGSTVIDAEDSIDVAGYTFGNIDEAVNVLKEQIAGMYGYPITRLFGQSAKGLNATGELDEKMYFDHISTEQERNLQPCYQTLLDVIYRNVFSQAPPVDYDFEFSPLWQMSDEQKANIANTNAQTITAYTNSGIFERDTALKEIKQLSDITGVGSNITDEDITEAEAEEPPTGEDVLDDYEANVKNQKKEEAELTGETEGNSKGKISKISDWFKLRRAA